MSAAARDGHISQPALSVIIAKLERELGVKLLSRTRDGVRATAAGQAVLTVAERMLHDADVVSAVARAAERSNRRLRIALTGPIAAPAIAAGIAAIASADVLFEVVPNQYPWEVSGLTEERWDVAMVAAPVTLPGVHAELVHAESRGVLVGPQSDLYGASTDDLSFEEISRHPAVDPVGPPERWLDDWAYLPQLNGQHLQRVGPEVHSIEATLVSAMTTPAMAFVPRSVGLAAQSFGLRYIDVSHGPPCEHVIAWRAPLRAEAMLFVEAVTGVSVSR